MLWWRMVMAAARWAGRDWYAPWRSPLLRWRLETYGLVDAQGHLLTAGDITPRRFRQFCWRERRPLVELLRWAATFPG